MKRKIWDSDGNYSKENEPIHESGPFEAIVAAAFFYLSEFTRLYLGNWKVISWFCGIFINTQSSHNVWAVVNS